MFVFKSFFRKIFWKVQSKFSNFYGLYLTTVGYLDDFWFPKRVLKLCRDYLIYAFGTDDLLKLPGAT